MFVSPEHFCDRRPRSFCVPSARVTQVFRQTRVVNNYNVNGKFIVNRGIPVEHISSVTHRSIEPIHVGSLPNAGRQGWRGAGFERTLPRGAANHSGRNFSNGNDQLHHGPAAINNPNHGANANRRESFGQPVPGIKPGGNQTESAHLQGQNHPQLGGNDRVPPQNLAHEPQPLPPRQFNGATEPNRTVPQNNLQPNHSAEHAAANVPQQHAAARVEPHPFVAPSQPRVEPRPAEAAPRNVTPPPVPAGGQGQAHNAGNGGDRGTDKDKPNH